MTRTCTLHRAAMLAAITVAKVNVFERLLMRKKLAPVAAILAFWLAVPCDVFAAKRVQSPSDWKWSDVIDASDLAALNDINSHWKLWDFGQSTSVPLNGIEIRWGYGETYEAVYDEWGDFLGYDLLPAEEGRFRVLSIWIFSSYNEHPFTASIPASLGNLSHLESLFVSADLTGSIPASLGNLLKLRKLELTGTSNHRLTGSIPASLGNLSELEVLDLSSNDLTGSIPASLGNLLKLQRLELTGNELTGSIPASLGNLLKLQRLELTGNELTGSIPASLGNLLKLQRLELSSNELTGPIPASLGNLSELQYLDLSSNQLTGPVPQELGTLQFLSYLSISHSYLAIDAASQKVLDQIQARAPGVTVHWEPQLVSQVTTIHRADAHVLPNHAGGINEPLVPVTDTDVLKGSTATAITGGLVCDGVTPLLFKIKAENAVTATTWGVHAYITDSGKVWNGLRWHVHVLADGKWQVAELVNYYTKVTVPAAAAGETTSEAYGYISAIAAEDLTVNGGHTATVKLVVQQLYDDGSPLGPIQTITFGLRKPPVVLVHGFDSDKGTWGPEFLAQLYGTRSTDFVVPIEYGTGSDAVDNTTGRFDQLAQILDGKLTSQIESAAAKRWPDWAWTRYDAVGHSQGGVLLRMLCTRWPLASFSSTGFRGAGNFNRGRFNRIITIGSPHNGSLILHAFLKMGWATLPEPRLQRLLQKKFDPFASGDNQVAQINHPAYEIDPGARFHLIRTTIQERFQKDGYVSLPWICSLLFFDQVTVGSSPKTIGSVLLQGRGFDGIVDYDSQGAGAGTPSSDLSSISHSVPVGLFGVQPGSTQTASAQVGQRVIQLLDESAGSGTAPGPTAFGQFVMPAPLSSERQSQIDAALPVVFTAGAINPKASGKQSAKAAFGVAAETLSSYRFSLAPDIANPLQGEVAWVACVYGPGGTTTDGVTVEVNANDSKEVTVTVDSDVQGDVVLYSSYFSTNGKMAFVPPALVVSRPPDSKLVSLSLKPNKASLQPGDTVPLEVWGTYDNNSTAQLFVPVSQTSPFSFVTSAPTVATVDGNGLVTAVGQGPATIAVTYEGLSATFPVTVNAGVAVITSQPADATTSVGGAASFSVGAAGSGLTYQWYANGTPVAGATSPTLSLNNVQPNQQGDYWVAVKNSSGTVLGNAARLAVEGVPPPTTPAPSTSPDLADAPEGISLVSFIPQSRAVKAGKTARSVKLMVMLSNNSLENVPVTVALSAEPAGVVTLSQSSMEMTVPGKKSAKQKAKTKRQSFTVLVPPTASGDVTIKATVGALSASSTLRVQAVKN